MVRLVSLVYVFVFRGADGYWKMPNPHHIMVNSETAASELHHDAAVYGEGNQLLIWLEIERPTGMLLHEALSVIHGKRVDPRVVWRDVTPW